jgi:hypothetical protein
MRIKVLRNLAPPYPIYIEGQVVEADEEVAKDLLQAKLAELTTEPITEAVAEAKAQAVGGFKPGAPDKPGRGVDVAHHGHQKPK